MKYSFFFFAILCVAVALSSLSDGAVDSDSKAFGYDSSKSGVQDFVVPVGVASVTAYIWGAGDAYCNDVAGKAGSFAKVTFPVNAQQKVRITVGRPGVASDCLFADRSALTSSVELRSSAGDAVANTPGGYAALNSCDILGTTSILSSDHGFASTSSALFSSDPYYGDNAGVGSTDALGTGGSGRVVVVYDANCLLPPANLEFAFNPTLNVPNSGLYLDSLHGNTPYLQIELAIPVFYSTVTFNYETCSIPVQKEVRQDTCDTTYTIRVNDYVNYCNFTVSSNSSTTTLFGTLDIEAKWYLFENEFFFQTFERTVSSFVDWYVDLDRIVETSSCLPVCGTDVCPTTEQCSDACGGQSRCMMSTQSFVSGNECATPGSGCNIRVCECASGTNGTYCEDTVTPTVTCPTDADSLISLGCAGAPKLAASAINKIVASDIPAIVCSPLKYSYSYDNGALSQWSSLEELKNNLTALSFACAQNNKTMLIQAKDFASNIGECSFKVKVEDSCKPSYFSGCPPNVDDRVICNKDSSYTPPTIVAFENYCPAGNQNVDAAAITAEGVTTVNYLYTDSQDNPSDALCSLTVVHYNTSHPLTCGDDIYVDTSNTSDDGVCERANYHTYQTNDIVFPASSTRCPQGKCCAVNPVTLDQVFNVAGTKFYVGTDTDITFRVSNAMGNEGTCSKKLIVRDIHPPCCPSRIIPVISAPNTCANTSTYGSLLIASDNVTPSSSLTWKDASDNNSFDMSLARTITNGLTYDLKVCDAANNCARCTGSFAIVDNEPCKASTCPPSYPNICAPKVRGVCFYNDSTFTAPTFSDNCPNRVDTASSPFSTGAHLSVSSTPYSFSYSCTDGVQTTPTSCGFSYTVSDCDGPWLGSVCDTSTVIVYANGNGVASAAGFHVPDYVDNCQVESTTYTGVGHSYAITAVNNLPYHRSGATSCSNPTYSWTSSATDVNVNPSTESCVVTIQVKDNTACVLNCDGAVVNISNSLAGTCSYVERPHSLSDNTLIIDSIPTFNYTSTTYSYGNTTVVGSFTDCSGIGCSCSAVVQCRSVCGDRYVGGNENEECEGVVNANKYGDCGSCACIAPSYRGASKDGVRLAQCACLSKYALVGGSHSCTMDNNYTMTFDYSNVADNAIKTNMTLTVIPNYNEMSIHNVSALQAKYAATNSFISINFTAKFESSSELLYPGSGYAIVKVCNAVYTAKSMLAIFSMSGSSYVTSYEYCKTEGFAVPVEVNLGGGCYTAPLCNFNADVVVGFITKSGGPASCSDFTPAPRFYDGGYPVSVVTPNFANLSSNIWDTPFTQSFGGFLESGSSSLTNKLGFTNTARDIGCSGTLSVSGARDIYYPHTIPASQGTFLMKTNETTWWLKTIRFVVIFRDMYGRSNFVPAVTATATVTCSSGNYSITQISSSGVSTFLYNLPDGCFSTTGSGSGTVTVNMPAYGLNNEVGSFSFDKRPTFGGSFPSVGAYFQLPQSAVSSSLSAQVVFHTGGYELTTPLFEVYYNTSLLTYSSYNLNAAYAYAPPSIDHNAATGKLTFLSTNSKGYNSVYLLFMTVNFGIKSNVAGSYSNCLWGKIVGFTNVGSNTYVSPIVAGAILDFSVADYREDMHSTGAYYINPAIPSDYVIGIYSTIGIDIIYNWIPLTGGSSLTNSVFTTKAIYGGISPRADETVATSSLTCSLGANTTSNMVTLTGCAVTFPSSSDAVGTPLATIVVSYLGFTAITAFEIWAPILTGGVTRFLTSNYCLRRLSTVSGVCVTPIYSTSTVKLLTSFSNGINTVRDFDVISKVTIQVLPVTVAKIVSKTIVGVSPGQATISISGGNSAITYKITVSDEPVDVVDIRAYTSNGCTKSLTDNAGGRYGSGSISTSVSLSLTAEGDESSTSIFAALSDGTLMDISSNSYPTVLTVDPAVNTSYSVNNSTGTWKVIIPVGADSVSKASGVKALNVAWRDSCSNVVGTGFGDLFSALPNATSASATDGGTVTAPDDLLTESCAGGMGTSGTFSSTLRFPAKSVVMTTDFRTVWTNLNTTFTTLSFVGGVPKLTINPGTPVGKYYIQASWPNYSSALTLKAIASITVIRATTNVMMNKGADPLSRYGCSTVYSTSGANVQLQRTDGGWIGFTTCCPPIISNYTVLDSSYKGVNPGTTAVTCSYTRNSTVYSASTTITVSNVNNNVVSFTASIPTLAGNVGTTASITINTINFQSGSFSFNGGSNIYGMTIANSFIFNIDDPSYVTLDQPTTLRLVGNSWRNENVGIQFVCMSGADHPKVFFNGTTNGNIGNSNPNLLYDVKLGSFSGLTFPAVSDGATFDIKITVNIPTGQYLQGFQFAVYVNSAIFTFVSFTKDAVWKSDPTTNFQAPGVGLIYLTNPASSFTGNTLIGTLRIKLAAGVAPTVTKITAEIQVLSTSTSIGFPFTTKISSGQPQRVIAGEAYIQVNGGTTYNSVKDQHMNVLGVTHHGIHTLGQKIVPACSVNVTTVKCACEIPGDVDSNCVFDSADVLFTQQTAIDSANLNMQQYNKANPNITTWQLKQMSPSMNWLRYGLRYEKLVSSAANSKRGGDSQILMNHLSSKLNFFTIQSSTNEISTIPSNVGDLWTIKAEFWKYNAAGLSNGSYKLSGSTAPCIDQYSKTDVYFELHIPTSSKNVNLTLETGTKIALSPGSNLNSDGAIYAVVPELPSTALPSIPMTAINISAICTDGVYSASFYALDIPAYVQIGIFQETYLKNASGGFYQLPETRPSYLLPYYGIEDPYFGGMGFKWDPIYIRTPSVVCQSDETTVFYSDAANLPNNSAPVTWGTRYTLKSPYTNTTNFGDMSSTNLYRTERIYANNVLNSGLSTANGTRYSPLYPFNNSMYTIEYNWLNTDSSVNVTCSYPFKVVDRVVPSFTSCPANQVFNVTRCGTTYDFTIPSVSFGDEISPLSGSSVLVSYPIEAAGKSIGDSVTLPVRKDGAVSTFIYTATDSFNNSATCSFTVAVIDNCCPSIPTGNITLYSSGTPSCSSAGVARNASDNLDGVIAVTFTGLTADYAIKTEAEGYATVVLTAADVAGNSCPVTVNVICIDNYIPSLSCPSTTEVYDVNAIGIYSYAFALDELVSLSDNDPNWLHLGVVADKSSPIALNCCTARSSTINVAGYDTNLSRNASCSWTIEVKDTTKPSFTCPAAQSAGQNSAYLSSSCNADVAGDRNKCSVTLPDLSSIAVSDNCLCGSTLTVGRTNSKISYSIGQTTVGYSASDSSSNSISCDQTITCLDTLRPCCRCYDVEWYTTNSRPIFNNGTCYDNVAVVSTTSETSDPDFPGYTICASPPVGGFDKTVMRKVTTVSGTDAAGNTDSCTSHHTIYDNKAPTLQCPSSTSNTITGTSFSYAYPDLQIADEIDSYNKLIISSRTSFTSRCDPTLTSGGLAGGVPIKDFGFTLYPGVNTFSVSVADSRCNIRECSWSVTVVDNTAPTTSVPANITENVVGVCTGSTLKSISWGTTASDNSECLVTQTYKLDSTQISSPYDFPASFTQDKVYTIVYEAVDRYGNKNTQSFYVTVKKCYTSPQRSAVLSNVKITYLSGSGDSSQYRASLTFTTLVSYPFSHIVSSNDTNAISIAQGAVCGLSNSVCKELFTFNHLFTGCVFPTKQFSVRMLTQCNDRFASGCSAFSNAFDLTLTIQANNFCAKQLSTIKLVAFMTTVNDDSAFSTFLGSYQTGAPGATVAYPANLQTVLTNTKLATIVAINQTAVGALISSVTLKDFTKTYYNDTARTIQFGSARSVVANNAPLNATATSVGVGTQFAFARHIESTIAPFPQPTFYSTYRATASVTYKLGSTSRRRLFSLTQNENDRKMESESRVQYDFLESQAATAVSQVVSMSLDSIPTNVFGSNGAGLALVVVRVKYTDNVAKIMQSAVESAFTMPTGSVQTYIVPNSLSNNQVMVQLVYQKTLATVTFSGTQFASAVQQQIASSTSDLQMKLKDAGSVADPNFFYVGVVRESSATSTSTTTSSTPTTNVIVASLDSGSSNIISDTTAIVLLVVASVVMIASISAVVLHRISKNRLAQSNVQVFPSIVPPMNEQPNFFKSEGFRSTSGAEYDMGSTMGTTDDSIAFSF